MPHSTQKKKKVSPPACTAHGTATARSRASTTAHAAPVARSRTRMHAHHTDDYADRRHHSVLAPRRNRCTPTHAHAHASTQVAPRRRDRTDETGGASRSSAPSPHHAPRARPILPRGRPWSSPARAPAPRPASHSSHGCCCHGSRGCCCHCSHCCCCHAGVCCCHCRLRCADRWRMLARGSRPREVGASTQRAIEAAWRGPRPTAGPPSARAG